LNVLYYEYFRRDQVVSASVHIYEVVRNLQKAGHEILYLPGGKKATGEARKTKKRKFLLKNFLLSGLFLSFLYEVRKGATGVALIHKTGFKPDILYARHCLFNSADFLSFILRIPLVKEVNGIVAEEYVAEGKAGKLTMAVLRIIEKQSLRKADKIIVVTPNIKDILINRFGLNGDTVQVIPLGADVELFRKIDQQTAKRELKLDLRYDYVCFCGSFYRWQGIDDLIRSIPLVIKSCPTARFLIVGDGIMKDELISLTKELGLEESILFTGNVPYEKVPWYISSADVCIVYKKPMATGYSPLKLYEYMACGKPVIASNVEGFGILEEHRAGMLVEPESPDMLADAIIRMLKNPQLREEMGRNARELVIMRHRWDGIVDEISGICTELVVKNR